MHLSYAEAKQILIRNLLQAASDHEAGHISAIETSFDSMDASLPRNAGPAFDKLLIALSFWDGWIDARNHNWHYYQGIHAEDWPHLARSIVEDLDADREITDERVLKHFDFRNTTKKA